MEALPPWAEKINQDIDAQIVGTIKQITMPENNKPIDIHVKVKTYLKRTKSLGKERKNLVLKVLDKRQADRLEMLGSKRRVAQDVDYIISLKVVKTINSEWLELITIDSYRDN